MGNHKDFATGTVLTAPSPATTGLSLVLQSGEGARQPTDFPFYVTACPDGEYPTLDNAEKLKVTAISTDTLTIERAQGDTTAKSIATGWRISNAIFTEDVENTTHVPNEVPSGTIDGSNTAFTTAAGYAPGSLKVFLNGARQTEGATDDYEETATGFTMNAAPETDDKLLVDYSITDATWEKGANAGIKGETPAGTVDSSNKIFTSAMSYIAGTMEVFVNGLLQKPVDDFTETTPGSGIFTMIVAPTTGDELIVRYDHVLSVGGNAQTVDGNSATALLNKDNHVLSTACSVYMNGDQSVATSVFEKLEFDEEHFDIGGNWDTTNHRFTAPVTGYYLVSIAVMVNNMSSNTSGKACIYVDEVLFARTRAYATASGDETESNLVRLCYVEEGQYIEGYVQHNSGVTENVDSSGNHTFMTIHLVGKA